MEYFPRRKSPLCYTLVNTVIKPVWNAKKVWVIEHNLWTVQKVKFNEKDNILESQIGGKI